MTRWTRAQTKAARSIFNLGRGIRCPCTCTQNWTLFVAGILNSNCPGQSVLFQRVLAQKKHTTDQVVFQNSGCNGGLGIGFPFVQSTSWTFICNTIVSPLQTNWFWLYQNPGNSTTLAPVSVITQPFPSC